MERFFTPSRTLYLAIIAILLMVFIPLPNQNGGLGLLFNWVHQGQFFADAQMEWTENLGLEQSHANMTAVSDMIAWIYIFALALPVVFLGQSIIRDYGSR